MDHVESAGVIFVRLDPGDPLVGSLRNLADEAALLCGSIASGVGMLTDPLLGFFSVERDDYERTQLAGTFDLSSIQGNVTRRDGVPVPHVHVVFNDPSLKTYSGHLIEARCHITMELLIVRTDALALARVKRIGEPATRIIWPTR